MHKLELSVLFFLLLSLRTYTWDNYYLYYKNIVKIYQIILTFALKSKNDLQSNLASITVEWFHLTIFSYPSALSSTRFNLQVWCFPPPVPQVPGSGCCLFCSSRRGIWPWQDGEGAGCQQSSFHWTPWRPRSPRRLLLCSTCPECAKRWRILIGFYNIDNIGKSLTLLTIIKWNN